MPIGSEKVWPDELDKESSDSRPFNAYDTAKTYADGRVELFHSQRPEMGIHCVLSGVVCSNLREHLPAICRLVWHMGGRISRLDLALNDLCGRINPLEATKHIEAGKVKCRAKEYPTYNDPRAGGYTQYCGKMASEVHLCLYNKSAEMGELGFLVRAEIRFKGKKADKAAKAFLEHQDCRPLILGFVDFPEWREWQDVFAVTPQTIEGERRDTNRVRWLLTQVAASIAKEVVECGGDLLILERISRAVMENLSAMNHSVD